MGSRLAASSRERDRNRRKVTHVRPTTSNEALETDYLIVGSGAMGLAFADVIIAESDDSVLLVDRHGAPGGHWNDAYPFVRLHQPSRSYGVASLPLGEDSINALGWNAGLYELASGPEVLAYFDRVMSRTLLPSGRAEYYPMCNYLGDRRFVSLSSGAEHRVKVRKRVIDATYTATEVPATHPPRYAVAEGAKCVPVNALGCLTKPYDGYVVIGAGKTGIDACLWLLENRVPPERIRWIVSRDPWLIDREHFQPGDDFMQVRLGSWARQMEIVNEADSVGHLFELLAKDGMLLRIDESVTPTKFRCAIVSRTELEQLRRIENVVRQGRVERIERDRIVLNGGEIPTGPGVLHVDCSAEALRPSPVLPVFADGQSTLQPVRMCQPAFSAAFIAHVELAYDDDELKNGLCTVIPYPDGPEDWLRMMLANSLNQFRWSQDRDLRRWIKQCRLDNVGGLKRVEGVESAAETSVRERFIAAAGPAVGKMQQFVAELDASTAT